MHKISQLDLDVFSHLLHLAQCSHIQDMHSLRPTLTSSQLLYHTELVELGSDTLNLRQRKDNFDITYRVPSTSLEFLPRGWNSRSTFFDLIGSLSFT